MMIIKIIKTKNIQLKSVNLFLNSKEISIFEIRLIDRLHVFFVVCFFKITKIQQLIKGRFYNMKKMI